MLSNHPSVLGSGGGTAYNIIGGTGLFDDGTAAAPSISFASDSDTGFYRVAANIIGVANNGSISLAFVAGGKIQGSGLDNELTLAGNGSVSLRAGGTNQNITLTPSGTGVVQIGDGASAGQLTLRTSVANTGTAALSLFSTGNVDLQIRNSSSNLSFFRDTTEFARFNTSNRFLLGTATDSGALLQIGTNTTNTAGGMVFGTDTFLYRSGVNGLVFNGSGTGDTGFNIAKAGTIGLGILYDGANAYLTATAGMLLRTNGGNTALTLGTDLNATFAAGITTGGSIVCAAGGTFQWNGRSALGAPSDGVIRLTNNAGSDFTRLQFGGTTASFPSLGRSGTQIEVLLADGSAYAKIAAGSVSLRTAAANGGAGEVVVGSTTQTTVGAAGGASALPATPSGFLKFKIGTVDYVFPYYAA